MTWLLGNGRLITRDEAQPYFEDGCVCIEGNRILEVGSTSTLKAKYPHADWVDAGGGVIMPGLINAHHHIYSAFARGMALPEYRPESFLDILEGMWWPLDAQLTLEDCRYSAYATYLDCIRNGVTTVFDHHASYGAVEGSLFEIGSVAAELGVRTCLCYEISDRHGPEQMKAGVLENEAFARAALKDPSQMQRAMLGLHAAMTLSDETLSFCQAHKPDQVGYHVHVAEGIEDVMDSLKRYGKRVVDRLFDRGVLGPLSLAVHCIHVSPQEMDILKGTGTMVVHNPESNMGNAVGCEPMQAMMAKGILLGLGTDGYTSDMLESYKVANLIHKHHLGDPKAAWAEIPQMLFVNNATIANRYFPDPLGVLRTGACADVIVLDYDPLTPMHAGNVNGHILFGMNGRQVNTTVIDGQIKMRHRAFIGVDESMVMARSREQALKLWKRLGGAQ